MYSDTISSTENELQTCPHIMLSSTHNWNKNAVRFKQIIKILHDVVGSMNDVSDVVTLMQHQQGEEY